MRELDLSLINILSTIKSKDSKNNLGASGSYYILQDILFKISIVSKRKTTSPFANSSKISHNELDRISTKDFVLKIIVTFLFTHLGIDSYFHRIVNFLHYCL
jgi:hypothetical protein